MTADPIRVGVIGVGRGMSFANSAEAAGMKLVALCDAWEDRVQAVAKERGVTAYADFDMFLEHDMDAVVLANYFHEHAPFAIKALRAGKHVMSETSCCLTLAQGVALAREVERSGLTYMLAENYPYMASNQEMRRLFQEGLIGDFRYGEGEYVHPDPADVKLRRSRGLDHWRNWLPATYYCTHSIAPVMFITGHRPVKVNGFVVPFDPDDQSRKLHVARSDIAGVIMCRMDNGAVVKSLHGGLRGHRNHVRIHGNKGLMESSRESGRVRVWREPWEKNEGEPVEQLFTPNFPKGHEAAMRTGHGGGDYFTNHHFAHAIRTGEPPFLDVYRGLDMTLCGIQAWRSVLNDSAPMDVPDLRDEAVRQQYENDHWSPAPDAAPEHKAPSSILGDLTPSPEALANAEKIWGER